MPTTTKRLAIYAHYDAEAEVKRFTTHYLAELNEHCSRVDFVSTAPLSETELSKVAPYCEQALTKDNSGFDFGMWKHVLDDIDFDEWDELLLTNSSVFGPLRPLAPMFEKMSGDDCDFWGVSDNFEGEWHIQSYFLVFKRAVLSSDAFKQFWADVQSHDDKLQVIRSYEIGLSRRLAEAGFHGRAYVPVDTLFSNGPMALVDRFVRNKERSPLCFHPLRTLRKGVPFVKAELLRDNPAEVWLPPVRRELRRSDYDLSLIEFDRPTVKRTLRERWHVRRAHWKRGR